MGLCVFGFLLSIFNLDFHGCSMLVGVLCWCGPIDGGVVLCCKAYINGGARFLFFCLGQMFMFFDSVVVIWEVFFFFFHVVFC